MSEEEIKNKANAIIENHREIDKMMVIEMVDLIQGLLDLYKKEKEKNKTLEELLQGNLFEMYKYYKNLCSSYQANCISKDKINAKIEECENKIKKIRSKKVINEPEDTIVITRYAHYISVLQSLLEKE